MRDYKYLREKIEETKKEGVEPRFIISVYNTILANIDEKIKKNHEKIELNERKRDFIEDSISLQETDKWVEFLNSYILSKNDSVELSELVSMAGNFVGFHLPRAESIYSDFVKQYKNDTNNAKTYYVLNAYKWAEVCNVLGNSPYNTKERESTVQAEPGEE